MQPSLHQRGSLGIRRAPSPSSPTKDVMRLTKGQELLPCGRGEPTQTKGWNTSLPSEIVDNQTLLMISLSPGCQQPPGVELCGRGCD